MPATSWHHGARRWMARARHDASMVVAAPAIRPLPAGVAAVQLRTARATSAMGGCVAHWAPPRLDDVLAEIGERSGWFDDVHELSLTKGCDETPWSHAAGAAGSTQPGRGPILTAHFRLLVNRLTG